MKALLRNGKFITWLRADAPKENFLGVGEELVEAAFVDTEMPVHNSTQKVEEAYIYDVSSMTVTRIWSVKAKTIEELRMVWTTFEFFARFTLQEYADTRALLPYVVDALLASTTVESDSPTTLNSLAAMVGAGIITETRKQDLLQ